MIKSTKDFVRQLHRILEETGDVRGIMDEWYGNFLVEIEGKMREEPERAEEILESSGLEIGYKNGEKFLYWDRKKAEEEFINYQYL